MDRSLLITASMGQGGTLDHQQAKQGATVFDVKRLRIWDSTACHT